MTQLLKHKSVITCVLNTERRNCFFWTLIMHWVTTPTPTSVVLVDYAGAGLAKNKPCARLPSPPPVLFSQANSQGFQLQKKKEQVGTADFTRVCPGQPPATTLRLLYIGAAFSSLSQMHCSSCSHGCSVLQKTGLPCSSHPAHSKELV